MADDAFCTTVPIFLCNHVQKPIIIIAYLICLLQIEFISVGHLIPSNAAGSEYPRCSEYPSQVSVACLHLLNEVIFYGILGILGISFSHIVELSFAQTLSLEMKPFCYFK